MIFGDTPDKVLGRWQTNPVYVFTIQVLSKDLNQKPSDVVNNYYSQLTPDQKRKCRIQGVDQPIEYFSDGALAGQPINLEDPHPTQHKTRLGIRLKTDIMNKILDEDGPISGPPYDFLCGRIMGATFGTRPPYLEFDDRTPDKYLLVGSRGVDDPPIDLNSLQF